MPNGIGGPTSASSSGAARFATSSGMYTSVHSGPWSPWSSVEPTGTMTRRPPPSRYSRTWRFVISGMKMDADTLCASYESPSEVRCSRERRIASVTSSSGGHGSPSNSISTESGPS